MNTVGEDLVLKSGAVSNAILSAAGPQLQALINKQASSGRTGDIIITNGCNLKSANVFHTIAPRWDNGQGAAQKVIHCNYIDDLRSRSECYTFVFFTYTSAY